MNLVCCEVILPRSQRENTDLYTERSRQHILFIVAPENMSFPNPLHVVLLMPDYI
jgi:hypothetical protein